MPATWKTALGLGAVGGFCGGCVSLLAIGLSGAAASLGFLFWGVVAVVPAGLLGVGVAVVRHRNLRAGVDGEACEVPAEGADGSDAADAADAGDAADTFDAADARDPGP